MTTSERRTTSSGVAIGTPGSIASARSREACDDAETATIWCPTARRAEPMTGPTWPMPMMPIPRRPGVLMAPLSPIAALLVVLRAL